MLLRLTLTAPAAIGGGRMPSMTHTHRNGPALLSVRVFRQVFLERNNFSPPILTPIGSCTPYLPQLLPSLVCNAGLISVLPMYQVFTAHRQQMQPTV
jgi:hypothetical protein